jgi:hypothetical protein
MLTDLSGPARALADYMSELSEQAYSAGWMKDLEFNLWVALQGESHEHGGLKLSSEQRLRLSELSAYCGGWIVFRDHTEETFLSLQEWRPEYEKWRSQRQPS